MNYYDLKEAAIYLKIPIQVLKAAIKKPVRPNGKFILHSINHGSVPMFSEKALDEFSKDLFKPWVNDPAKDRRPTFPVPIQDAMYFEAGEECANCHDPWDLEIGHIIDYKDCLHHHPVNLILLCGKCHKLHDREKTLSTETLKILKGKLIERWTMSFKKVDPIQVFLNPLDLKKAIDEFLKRNEFLFRTMGPSKERLGSNEGANFWDEIKMNEIIPNNRNILLLFQLNKHLIESDGRFSELAQKFTDHAISYEKFIQTPNEDHKNHLFPTDFASFIKEG